VRVVGPRGLVGEVIASVTLDSQLATKLTKQAGLEQKDQVAILQSGLVVGGPPAILNSAAHWTERPQTVKLGGKRYRAISSVTLGRAFNAMADELETRLAELEAERGRLRDAFSRLGEALGATHDPDQLLRVIVETAVEATGAHGGILVSHSGEVVQIGNPAAG